VRDENDDANSNRLSIRDPNNVGEDCIFDARNRETSCTDTAGDTTQKFYDAHNNVVDGVNSLNMK
jgi:YD repeat-containing protein